MFEIEEYAQVFMDCAVINEHHELIFTSIYGGESSIARILAAIENNNLKRIRCYGHSTLFHVDFPDRKRLHCKKIKINNPTFAHFIHCQMYERDVHFSEGAINAHVLVREGESTHDLLWQRIKAMTVTPLLDEWKMQLITHLFEEGKIMQNHVFSSSDRTKLKSYTIMLDILALNPVVVEMLKTEQLVIPA